jgi:hypothetical protein
LPLTGYVVSSAGRLSSSVAAIQKQVERLGGSFSSKIDEHVGLVISCAGKLVVDTFDPTVSSVCSFSTS